MIGMDGFGTEKSPFGRTERSLGRGMTAIRAA